jgi:uncharacterized protein
VHTSIMWEALSWPSIEHVLIDETPAGGWTADGVMIGVIDGGPTRLTYRLDIGGDGAVRTVDVSEAVGGQRIALRSDGHGRWRDAAGAPLSALDGCVDVDISTTPLTNTLPIRRLGLAVGDSREITVGYVDVPGLALHGVQQQYARLDEFTYRYASGTFTADVTVDADGLVTDYAGLWRRVTDPVR